MTVDTKIGQSLAIFEFLTACLGAERGNTRTNLDGRSCRCGYFRSRNIPHTVPLFSDPLRNTERFFLLMANVLQSLPRRLTLRVPVFGRSRTRGRFRGLPTGIQCRRSKPVKSPVVLPLSSWETARRRTPLVLRRWRFVARKRSGDRRSKFRGRG